MTDTTNLGRKIIELLTAEKMTCKEAADYIFTLSAAISAPAYQSTSEMLSQPLSDFVDLIEL